MVTLWNVYDAKPMALEIESELRAEYDSAAHQEHRPRDRVHLKRILLSFLIPGVGFHFDVLTSRSVQ